ncbi:MAG: hypothetical protein NTV22_05730 [bacterium]|nr:hypothetical protein [bacterium]
MPRPARHHVATKTELENSKQPENKLHDIACFLLCERTTNGNLADVPAGFDLFVAVVAGIRHRIESLSKSKATNKYHRQAIKWCVDEIDWHTHCVFQTLLKPGLSDKDVREFVAREVVSANKPRTATERVLRDSGFGESAAHDRIARPGRYKKTSGGK